MTVSVVLQGAHKNTQPHACWTSFSWGVQSVSWSTQHLGNAYTVYNEHLALKVVTVGAELQFRHCRGLPVYPVEQAAPDLAAFLAVVGTAVVYRPGSLQCHLLCL
eukprot:jgi/Chrzof1/1017/Cz01g37080.t1